MYWARLEKLLFAGAFQLPPEPIPYAQLHFAYRVKRLGDWDNRLIQSKIVTDLLVNLGTLPNGDSPTALAYPTVSQIVDTRCEEATLTVTITPLSTPPVVEKVVYPKTKPKAKRTAKATVEGD